MMERYLSGEKAIREEILSQPGVKGVTFLLDEVRVFYAENVTQKEKDDVKVIVEGLGFKKGTV